MIELGKFNNLTVLRKVDFGIYLDADDLGEILLPGRYVPVDTGIGDVIEVFIYRDSEDRLIATTERPLAQVGEFALLEAVAVNKTGAFLAWGLTKDLLVPFSEQKHRMEKGKSYLVRIFVDKKSDRIVASSKIEKFLHLATDELTEGQKVDLVIANRTNLGYNAVIDNQFLGVLFNEEIFQPIGEGRKITGFIKKIREDKKIDLCLQKPGYKKVPDLADRILEEIRNQGGQISISDKSDPEIIYNLFGVSKKTYKKVLGLLYKKRIIEISESGVKLVKQK